jgi:histidyl-tRNA synthetase
MKAADRSGAKLTLVLGDRDLAEGTIGVKDMATGDQRQIPLDETVAAVAAALTPAE